MSRKVIFFNPIFKEKIWGGDKLKDFGYELPSNKVGECWAFSTHPNGQNVVKNGEFKGKTLEELWIEHREIFGGYSGEKFPLLIKIIDANDNLSIQVHPGNEYAQKNENDEFGKTECWYIMDCSTDANIIYGINAENKIELDAMIDKGEWEELLQTISIRKGDFLYVPSGTVHALKSGTLVYEIQQNSDTTYRLYDYDRKDEQGNLRELHIQKSKDVIKVPFFDKQPTPKVVYLDGITKTKFIESPYFTVERYEVVGQANLTNNQPFILLSVIDGEGIIRVGEESYSISKGDHFMLSCEVTKYSLSGTLSMMASFV